jgi:hypothetical protein
MSLDMSVATAAIAAAVMRKFETAMASASRRGVRGRSTLASG